MRGSPGRFFVAFGVVALFGSGPLASVGEAQVKRTKIEEERLVPPYSLPDPLKMEDGSPVADAAAWREKRRPELMRIFEREVYGRTPIGRPEAMRFELIEEKADALDGKATRLRVAVLFAGKADGPKMELLVYLPNAVKGKAPMFLGLNFQGNHATSRETDIPVPTHWMRAPKGSPNRASEATRGAAAGRWQYEYAIDHGYGVATACYNEVEPDENGRAADGVRSLAPPRGESDWGAIGGWAWALSRALDYLETHPRVDARRVVLIGHSRLGKTSLWAGAQDERFAVVVSNDSGAGGAALSKRIFGETVENLTTAFPHWFCPRFKTYADHEEKLPVDQHQLIALVAPRPVLIHSATEDLWADPKGEFLAALAADPVYRLLGAGGIAHRTQPKPGEYSHGTVGYFLRPGKHDVTLEDWKSYVAFADAHLPK